MGHVQELERLLVLAKANGYTVRFENLVGVESSVCQIGSQRFLFLDLNQNSEDLLAVVKTALDHENARIPNRAAA